MAHASSAENHSLFSLFAVSLLVAGGAAGQNPPAASRLQPNLAGNIERPLRYTPDGQEFVIENGGEFFNRPLYGGNTAFRADAGDQPEFSLYLPGHGGNLRFGIKTSSGARWLHEAARITARYRPGTMLYENPRSAARRPRGAALACNCPPPNGRSCGPRRGGGPRGANRAH